MKWPGIYLDNLECPNCPYLPQLAQHAVPSRLPPSSQDWNPEVHTLFRNTNYRQGKVLIARLASFHSRVVWRRASHYITQLCYQASPFSHWPTWAAFLRLLKLFPSLQVFVQYAQKLAVAKSHRGFRSGFVSVLGSQLNWTPVGF